MNNTEHTPSSQVLERIRSGKVKMKPKIFFVLKALLLLGVAFLVLIVSTLLASFIFFGLRVGGHESLLGFGFHGFTTFLLLFPWPLALLDILLLAVLELLLRQFKFAYRRSLLYSFLVLAVVAGASGFLFDTETRFHDDRFEESKRGALPPPFQGVYNGAHPRAPERLGVYRGFVTGIGEETFSMTHDDQDNDADDRIRVVLPPPHFPLSSLEEGDRVYVAGEEREGVITAYGINVLED